MTKINKEKLEQKIGFKKELAIIINKYSKENNSDTPDFLLAEYLNDCLELFNKMIVLRGGFYLNGNTNRTNKVKKTNQ